MLSVVMTKDNAVDLLLMVAMLSVIIALIVDSNAVGNLADISAKR